MLYACLLSVKEKSPGAAQEIGLRAQWKYPEEVKYIAEYWLQTGTPRVIGFFETDNPAAFLKITAQWDVLYDVKIIPAITAEDGLKIASRMQGE